MKQSMVTPHPLDEQSGEERATYGANLIEKLATDMTRRFGRGFSRQNLWQMRQFGLAYPPERILQTLSEESEQPLPRSSSLQTYVRLLAVKNPRAREFYEAEALDGGWSVRQLDRQEKPTNLAITSKLCGP